MASNVDEALHEFVTERYPELRRSAFLMCGDWALAEEQTQKSLARLVAESRRGRVYDRDAYVYSHLLTSFQGRKPRREHLYVAANPAPDTTPASSTASSPEKDTDPVLDTTPAAAHSDPRTDETPAAARADATPGETSADGRSGATSPAIPTAARADATPDAESPAAHADATPPATPVGAQADGPAAAVDPVQTILVLDALHKLSTRCRAVLILRHWEGFAVDETADMLGLPDDRVDAYDAAGLAALDYLLHAATEREPAAA